MTVNTDRIVEGLLTGITEGPTRADALMPRLIQQESGGNPLAVSPKGAQGLTQTMPATGQDPGFGVTPISDPFDPAESKRFGRDYLNAMIDRYDDERLGLMAYNWGPGNVDRWVRGGRKASEVPAETKSYVSSILGTQVAEVDTDSIVEGLFSNKLKPPVTAPQETPDLRYEGDQAADLPTLAGAGMMRDQERQIDYIARRMNLDRDRFGVHDGQIYYRGDDGENYAVVGDVLDRLARS